MTANPGEIFSLYRQADAAMQLALYLQFRELREDFFKIDQEETDRTGNAGAKDCHGVRGET